MICPYCKNQVEVSRDPASPIWVAKCECTEAKHPWLERAMEILLHDAYKANSGLQNNASPKTKDDAKGPVDAS